MFFIHVYCAGKQLFPKHNLKYLQIGLTKKFFQNVEKNLRVGETTDEQMSQLMRRIKGTVGRKRPFSAETCFMLGLAFQKLVVTSPSNQMLMLGLAFNKSKSVQVTCYMPSVQVTCTGGNSKNERLRVHTDFKIALPIAIAHAHNAIFYHMTK